MPVWFVLGVQSSASVIVVNCFEAGDVPFTLVVVPGEALLRCTQINAPTTTMISKIGIPMLSNKRVRAFIPLSLLETKQARGWLCRDTTAKQYVRARKRGRTATN